MTYKIQQIEGIGAHYAERLGSAGILTSDRLLDVCKTPEGLQRLESSTGISSTHLQMWMHRADLMRVSGIGPEYGELLEQCGIETVTQLAQRDPENILVLMRRMNAEQQLARALPALKTIGKWVDRAKILEPALVH